MLMPLLNTTRTPVPHRTSPSPSPPPPLLLLLLLLLLPPAVSPAILESVALRLVRLLLMVLLLALTSSLPLPSSPSSFLRPVLVPVQVLAQMSLCSGGPNSVETGQLWSDWPGDARRLLDTRGELAAGSVSASFVTLRYMYRAVHAPNTDDAAVAVVVAGFWSASWTVHALRCGLRDCTEQMGVAAGPEWRHNGDAAGEQ
jgi:hypothetical protein